MQTSGTQQEQGKNTVTIYLFASYGFSATVTNRGPFFFSLGDSLRMVSVIFFHLEYVVPLAFGVRLALLTHGLTPFSGRWLAAFAKSCHVGTPSDIQHFLHLNMGLFVSLASPAW